MLGAAARSFLAGRLDPLPVAMRAVRTAKFIARKQWIVCGADDMFVRIYNYNTMDKVKAFEAHTDYIRSAALMPAAGRTATAGQAPSSRPPAGCLAR